ncbi:TolC family outer membrane protein [uncultured Algimonas sp.]|uniref:TolC family outer membrane protein n=1 Tax=uncultured Algimonas sp. TaxID=1547920 RepID=UPI00261851C6|nr:TolC family outer membrane protein [uncultured Algimonas sp.]
MTLMPKSSRASAAAVCAALLWSAGATLAAAQTQTVPQTQTQSQILPQVLPPEAGDTLQSVLASVYRGNPQLLAERARLREVDENYVQARAQGRPNLSLSGSASLQADKGVEGDTPNPFNPNQGEWVGTEPRSAQFNVLQPIYQGGRVKALKRQAKAGILAARAGLDGAENNVFLSAAQAYVDVLRDEEAARIRRNNVRVLTRQLSAADARFEVGEGTRTDTAQSQSRLAAAEAGLAQADAQLETSRARFVRLVGRMPNRLQPVPEVALPGSLEAATVLALANNPQLLAAYYNELSGEAAIDVAKAAGRPTVNLQGSVGRSRGSLLGFSDGDQAILGAQLSVPIFSGGANASRVRQARHARTRLGFEARDTERAVHEAVAQVWAQLEASRRIVEAGRRQVAAAETAFEGVELEQQVGTRTQLDVLDAEQETLDARLTLIDAQRGFDTAAFQLLATIGVFDVDGLNLPVAEYDPDIHLAVAVDDGLKRVADRILPERLGGGTTIAGDLRAIEAGIAAPADEPVILIETP